MARKGENIYKRKDGRWEGRYHKINMADGRQKYASVYGKTYKEVKEKLFLKKREQLLEKGGYGCLPTGLTIGEAAGIWLEERRGAWKESTLSTYRSITEKHILPLIGSVQAEAWDFAAYREYFKILREGKQGKKTFRAVSAPDTHYFRTDSAVPEGQIPLYRAGTAPRALRRQTQAGTSPSGNRYTEAGSIPAERSAERGCYLHGHPPDRLQRNPYRRTVCPEMGRYQF